VEAGNLIADKFFLVTLSLVVEMQGRIFQRTLIQFDERCVPAFRRGDAAAPDGLQVTLKLFGPRTPLLGSYWERLDQLDAIPGG
jgi:hypothetical protein